MFIYSIADKQISWPVQVSSCIPLSNSSMSLHLGLQSEKGLRTVYSNTLFQEGNTDVLFKNRSRNPHYLNVALTFF